jgi:hypothetical protein
MNQAASSLKQAKDIIFFKNMRTGSILLKILIK